MRGFNGLVMLAMAVVLLLGSHVEAGLKAKTDLVGPGAFRAKVMYFEGLNDEGVFTSRLMVHVRHALPMQPVEVAVDGVVVGAIATNPAGNGKLKIKTPEDVLPPILASTIITVGPVSGPLFTTGEKYKVQGELALEGTTVSGHVKYQQVPKQGQLDRRFHVSVEGATPGEVYDVLVNGVLVGSITIGSDGEGQLRLRSANFVHGNGWQPMPDSFLPLVAGDVVQVGPMSTIVE